MAKSISSQPLVPAEDIDFILEKLAKLQTLEQFKGESILITGGTGFFGKWLTQALLAMNDRLGLENHISLLSRDVQRTRASQPWLNERRDVRLIEADIRQLKTVKSYSTIIHGAASASLDLNINAPEVMFDTIVEGTKRVLAVAAAGGTRRLQIISSGAVYGPQPFEVDHVDESYLGGPRTNDVGAAYGEAKRASEMLASIQAKRTGFSLSTVRCFAFVGPYLPLDTHFAAGNFINDVLNNKPIVINGDGTARRSYLYAADLVVWLLVSLLAKDSRVINVGSDQTVNIRQLADIVDSEGKKLIPARSKISQSVQCTNDPVVGTPASRYVPSVTLARKVYGLEVWTDLGQALRKTLAWHLACRKS